MLLHLILRSVFSILFHPPSQTEVSLPADVFPELLLDFTDSLNNHPRSGTWCPSLWSPDHCVLGNNNLRLKMNIDSSFFFFHFVFIYLMLSTGMTSVARTIS